MPVLLQVATRRSSIFPLWRVFDRDLLRPWSPPLRPLLSPPLTLTLPFPTFAPAFPFCWPPQSKECQKKAWSRHKEKCALNRKYQPAGGGEPKPMKDLRAFTSKHRPTISEAAATALGVAQDPKRAQEFVFVIFLRPRPASGRIETAFFAFGAAVVPFSAFSKEQIAEMKGQLKSAHDLNVKNGSLGAMEVVLMCMDPNVVNVVMMGFSDDPSPLENPGENWKHWLLNRLNEGVVC